MSCSPPNTVLLDPFLVAQRLPIRYHAGLPHKWMGDRIQTVSTEVIPYGSDRLVYLWAATQAATTEDLEEFNLRSIPALFGVSWSPAAVAVRLRRLHHARIERSSRGVYQSLSLFDYLEIHNQTARVRFGNRVRGYPCRVARLDVIRSLARARRQGTLGLYLWLVDRATRAHKAVRVPLAGAHSVNSQTAAITCPRRARHEIRQHLTRLVSHWPDCPHHIVDDLLCVEPTAKATVDDLLCVESTKAAA